MECGEFNEQRNNFAGVDTSTFSCVGAVFLIWEMREASAVLSIIGCGIPAALAYHKWAYSLHVNVDEIFEKIEGGLGYPIEWKLWALTIVLFLIAIPLLKKEQLCTRKARMALLTTALLIAFGGGIIISIVDFELYSIYILARSIVLILISWIALHRKREAQEESAVNHVWIWMGILLFFIYIYSPSLGNLWRMPPLLSLSFVWFSEELSFCV